MQGFSLYFRFIARRERVTSLAWLIGLAGSAAGFSLMYPGMFPDEASMLAMSEVMNTPVMVALMGPVYGLGSLSQAIVMSQECLIWFVIAAAIMNIFFVNRHTRADEELGRHEMLRALPVGRLTGAAAALSGAFALDVAIFLVTAIGLLMADIGGTTAAGAFAYAASIAMPGFLFAALALLAAQLFSTARGVSGMMFALIGVFYAMRMSGDLNGSALSVISPLGLPLRVQPFYANRFMPIALLFIEAALAAAAALAVCAARDSGEGAIPARKGRRHASRFLKGELGLAWRLTRGGFFGWAAGMLAIGLTYGSVVVNIDQFIADNEMYSKMLQASGGVSVTDSFTAMVIAIGAMLAAVPVLLTAGKLRSEEKRGRLEQILSKSVPRERMLGSFLGIAAVESAVLLALQALGYYISAPSLDLGVLLGASLAYFPALLAMIGISALLVGSFPKLAGAVWAVFGYAFMAFYFGKLFGMPDWVFKISPFGSIPQLPAQEMNWLPLALTTAIAAVMAALGIAGFKRRDVG